jgi:hypothetical protein
MATAVRVTKSTAADKLHSLISCRCQAAAQHHPLHAAAAGVAASLLLLSSNPAYANAVFEGPARVVDGDTLYIGMHACVSCQVVGKYGLQVDKTASVVAVLCCGCSVSVYVCGCTA